ncbi:6-phosphofructokinase [Croceimicrobium hydrocarbonivorans]|uniref:ATP-dependent 6-phosphofructokinase n=1 Tax=Croceimicrobium hydrocarbonivorans TaxID=2761580 RepID=A0A7H0VIS3_9FLAO|nr:6-phosphofructokinase [Croceimicrobium hydrocarbonivorans]QNR25621.1 6-phosphofructokinase [Croceimicrobium hydrocarbonivorans]
MAKEINSIGVLTSGGDAPGMNAAIRAVVRAGNHYGKRVFGIYEGYQGLIENQILELNARSVKGILNRGGTILKSSRSEEFKTKEGRKRAYENLQAHGIDALVLIGGNGTFTGGMYFSEEFDFPLMGLPGTIDNDLAGTDFTIGFDTACNVVIECVDRIRDTAESHNRLFLVEVMGRDSGFIGLRAGVASGAVDVIFPEEENPMIDLFAELERGASNNKTNRIILVSEGNKMGSIQEIAAAVKERYPQWESKITILGHLQRGGSPTCTDRVLASRLGVAAIESLLDGRRGEAIGIVNNQLAYMPFEEAIRSKAKLDMELNRILKILAS